MVFTKKNLKLKNLRRLSICVYSVNVESWWVWCGTRSCWGCPPRTGTPRLSSEQVFFSIPTVAMIHFVRPFVGPQVRQLVLHPIIRKRNFVQKIWIKYKFCCIFLSVNIMDFFSFAFYLKIHLCREIVYSMKILFIILTFN